MQVTRFLPAAFDAVRPYAGLVGATALARTPAIPPVPVMPPEPGDTARDIMIGEFVAMPADTTVGAVLRHLREAEHTRESVYSVFVVDPSSQAFVGAVSLRRLIRSAPEVMLAGLVREGEPLAVGPDEDRDVVARLIARHNLLAVPVVDEARRILGIVAVDDVIDSILEESTDDVRRFGGVAANDAPYLKIGFLDMLRQRAGWLCVLFLSEMLTASAMQHFNDELQRAVVLTLFIPLIMSSGGNSGSQATSLLIRALALGQLRLGDWWRVALRELPTGLALGGILALLGMVRIAAWQQLGIYDYGAHWRLVALTVGAGLVGVVTFGSMTGSMLPFLLKRVGFDPASASAPFVATLVDVAGLVIYFTVALLVLRGTLL